jgi:hypothetical protein
MADKKISQLTSLTTPVSGDLFLVVDNPTGTPVSKSITLKNIAGNMPNTSVSFLTASANATFSGAKTTLGGDLTISNSKSVTSNNATTLLGAGMQGTIMWDANYLYVATSNTVIKRVALQEFNS